MGDPAKSQKVPAIVRRRSTTASSSVLKPVKSQQIRSKETTPIIQEESGPTNSPPAQRGESLTSVPNVNAEYKLSNLWGLTEAGSEILENKGSVARDHMANERTFLSWIRTSLGLATAGVGVTQLLKLVDEKTSDRDELLLRIGKPIGGSFIAIAILCVIFGLQRFFKTQALLKEEKYPPTRLSVLVLVLLVLAVTIVTLVAILHAS